MSWSSASRRSNLTNLLMMNKVQRSVFKVNNCVRITAGPDLLLAGPLFINKCWTPNMWIPPSPDCLHPTRTVVIIDILLRTRAAMHTTIAAAAVWQFEASLSEANCFCGAPFLWGPLFGRTCWTCINPPLLIKWRRCFWRLQTTALDKGSRYFDRGHHLYEQQQQLQCLPDAGEVF